MRGGVLGIAGLATIILPACASPRGATYGIEDPIHMTKILLDAIPPGSDLSAARLYLEEAGFECQAERDSVFGDRKGLDYLYGSRYEGGPLVKRRWQVAIVHRDGKVTEVLASTGLMGL